MPAAQDFIFDEACRAQLNSILRDFRGTHNFHNFATGASPNDGNSKRYILSMECTDTLQIRVGAALAAHLKYMTGQKLTCPEPTRQSWNQFEL